MRVPPRRQLSSLWRLRLSSPLSLFPVSSLSSSRLFPRLEDATPVSVLDMSRINAGHLGLVVSSALAITILGIALMGFGLRDARIALVITWPLLEFARCFCMNMRSCGSGIGATAVSIRPRLSWASGVFCAPLANRLPGFVILLFPLPGLSLPVTLGGRCLPGALC